MIYNSFDYHHQFKIGINIDSMTLDPKPESQIGTLLAMTCGVIRFVPGQHLQTGVCPEVA